MRTQKQAVTVLVLLLLTSAGTSGCAFSQLRKLGQASTRDINVLAQCQRQAGCDPAPIQQRLTGTAREAAAQAESASPIENAIAFDRIAAESAWKAGEIAGNDLEKYVRAGQSACESLPEARRPPRDCTMLALYVPYAIADVEIPKLNACGTKLKALPPGMSLPASDCPELDQIARSLADQFDAVTVVAKRAPKDVLDPPFFIDLEEKRAKLYCSVVLAQRLHRAILGGPLPPNDPYSAARTNCEKTYAGKLPACGLPGGTGSGPG